MSHDWTSWASNYFENNEFEGTSASSASSSKDAVVEAGTPVLYDRTGKKLTPAWKEYGWFDGVFTIK